MRETSTSQVGLTDWDRIRAMRDEDIDLSDSPEVTEEMLKTAVWFLAGQRVSKGMKIVKVALDPDVIEYFKAKAGDRAYWELINEVLKERMREELQAENDTQLMPETVA